MHEKPKTSTRCRVGISFEKKTLEEIDALIAGASRKVAAVLQLLKEAGMRVGEAWKLRWIDIDQERQTIRCGAAKHGNPRMFKASSKLLAMLNSLAKDSDYVFRQANIQSFRSNYIRQRRRIADKLKSPRILKISFHTFRHWKATMEYHRTKDILYVRNLLGHRKIESTMVHTQLIQFETEDHFMCKVAKTVLEAKQLVEAGFDYVTDIEGVKLFRKRK